MIIQICQFFYCLSISWKIKRVCNSDFLSRLQLLWFKANTKGFHDSSRLFYIREANVKDNLKAIISKSLEKNPYWITNVIITDRSTHDIWRYIYESLILILKWPPTTTTQSKRFRFNFQSASVCNRCCSFLWLLWWISLISKKDIQERGAITYSRLEENRSKSHKIYQLAVKLVKEKEDAEKEQTQSWQWGQ